MRKPTPDYEKNVFINCPYDPHYRPLFNAIVFTIHDAGFRPRCGLEASDTGQARLEKIMQIISECRYGIHDISRTSLDAATQLPRFNMPFELGLDLGCRGFGAAHHRRKVIMVLDESPHRYYKFFSDIAGREIHPHAGSPEQVINQVRDWLRETSGNFIPSGSQIIQRYNSFNAARASLCERLKLDLDDLSFIDFSYLVAIWLKTTSQ